MDEQEFFNKIKELQKQRDLLKKDVTVLECWQEMQKHQPFGWVKYANKYIFISAIDSNNDYEIDFDDYTFADGTPFGIREE